MSQQIVNVAGGSSDAEGATTIWHSPAEAVALKQHQLQQLRPNMAAAAVGMYALRLLTLPLHVAYQFMRAFGFWRPISHQEADDPAAPAVRFPVHHEWHTVNGIRLHCVSPGRQPGKPLMLMLHGFPELWYSWRHQMPAFAVDYDVVAVDMRGYNISDKPQNVASYRPELLASDVVGLVRALGHQRCTLVGHDWGGIVGWVVAGLHGSSILERLIVLGCPHTGVAMTNYDAEQYNRSAYFLLFQIPLVPELMMMRNRAQDLLNLTLTSPEAGPRHNRLSPKDAEVYASAISQPGAPRGMVNYYRALLPQLVYGADPDSALFRALRAIIGVPTLVLHGDSDVAAKVSLLNGIEAAVPNSTVHIIHNCSHWVQQDWPELVTKLMKQWLEAQHKQARPPEQQLEI